MFVEITVAPINNKLGTGSVPKRGAGLLGKSSSSGGKGPSLMGKSSTSGNKNAGLLGKSGSGGKGFSLEKSTNSGSAPSFGKSTLFPQSPSTGKSTSNSYSPASGAYSSSKSNKTAFGIIWLPTRKHNKHKKDLVYNPHREDRRDRDRSPSMYNLMSGDSPDLPSKKREEEATLLMPERGRAPAPPVVSAAAAGAGVAAAASGGAAAPDPQPEPAATGVPDEKQGFIQRDKNENNEAAGDANEDKEYLDNDDLETKKQSEGNKTDENPEKGKFGDKVDSVYLRPPPPHKARSTTSTANEEEDCGIKCLYYTLQCCDCVLM